MKVEIKQLRADFPDFRFVRAKKSKWESSTGTIFYNGTDEIWHELGHATLEHRFSESDVGLLRMERAAWTRGSELAGRYGVEIAEDFVEERMDHYRQWLHRRSLCSQCKYNGVEEGDGYRCVMCGNTWNRK